MSCLRARRTSVVDLLHKEYCYAVLKLSSAARDNDGYFMAVICQLISQHLTVQGFPSDPTVQRRAHQRLTTVHGAIAERQRAFPKHSPGTVDPLPEAPL